MGRKPHRNDGQGSDTRGQGEKITERFFEDGTIVRSGGPGAESRGAMQSRREYADGEVEIVFRIEERDFLHFGVRQGRAGHCRAIYEAAEAERLVGRWHRLVFTMKGDEVAATLDGKPKELVRSGTPRTGRIQIGGGSSAGMYEVSRDAVRKALGTLL